MNLILLYGPPAVGKLTIAKKLQERIGYPEQAAEKIISYYSLA